MENDAKEVPPVTVGPVRCEGLAVKPRCSTLEMMTGEEVQGDREAYPAALLEPIGARGSVWPRTYKWGGEVMASEA